jgi:hypothetical protein
MDDARAVALHEAVKLHTAIGDLGLELGVAAGETVANDEAAVLTTAETFLAWLRGPAVLTLHRGPVTKQQTGLPSGTILEGVPVSQIHDDEEYDLTLAEADWKGFATDGATPPVWTSSDETVVPVNVSADGKTFTVRAGNPGVGVVVKATVTKDDGSLLEITESVDVVPAGVETASFAASAVRKQAAAEPPAAPAADPAAGDPAAAGDVPAGV